MISNLSALILFVFMLSHGSPALSYDFSTPATDIATASGNPGQSIYEKYKDAIVDVDVRIEMTDGKVRHRGGSGFFVDREGHILTDAHVVKFKNKPQITLAELGNIKKITYFVILNSKNRKYRAKLVGANDYADIALLKVINIDPKDYAVVRFGDPDRLRVGDKIWAIGNQRSFANSLTGGGVSYLHRHIDLSYIEDFIQTDCPINPGNSGCPVFNEREEVVGITQAIMTQSDGPAFATSINLARIDLLKRGELELPSLGFEAMIDNFPRDGSSPGVHGFEDLQTLKMKTEIEEIENLVALARETYFNNWAIVPTYRFSATNS